MFCNILDIAAYNALILFLSIRPNYKNGVLNRRREFSKELAKSLLPKIDENNNLLHLQQPAQSIQGQQIKRCFMCPCVSHRKTCLQCA